MARPKQKPVNPGKDADPLDAPVERENREKDKKPTDPYRGIPKDAPRDWYTVHNLEVPGEQIEACINGYNFTIQHGETVPLHRSQVEVLTNAIIETFELQMVESGGGMVRKEVPITRPRYSVIPSNGPKASPRRTNQVGIGPDYAVPIVEKPRPTGPLIEGRAGQEPRVIAGRTE